MHDRIRLGDPAIVFESAGIWRHVDRVADSGVESDRVSDVADLDLRQRAGDRDSLCDQPSDFFRSSG